MKDDTPTPAEVPRKRRQLEDRSVVLDRWIAEWLAGDDITPPERRRLEAEKARRKQLEPEHRLGLVVAQEGMTPDQWAVVCDALRVLAPTEVVHTRLSRRQHGTLVGVCQSLGASTRLVGDVRDEMAAAKALLHEVEIVVAAPREATVQTYATPGVWSIIGLARHRRLPVQVILPNGQIN